MRHGRAGRVSATSPARLTRESGVPAPAAVARLRRKGAPPGHTPGSPGARAPVAKGGAERPERTKAGAEWANGCLASPSHTGLWGRKRARSANSGLTRDSSREWSHTVGGQGSLVHIPPPPGCSSSERPWKWPRHTQLVSHDTDITPHWPLSSSPAGEHRVLTPSPYHETSLPVGTQ